MRNKDIKAALTFTFDHIFERNICNAVLGLPLIKMEKKAGFVILI